MSDNFRNSKLKADTALQIKLEREMIFDFKDRLLKCDHSLESC